MDRVTYKVRNLGRRREARAENRVDQGQQARNTGFIQIEQHKVLAVDGCKFLEDPWETNTRRLRLMLIKIQEPSALSVEMGEITVHRASIARNVKRAVVVI